MTATIRNSISVAPHLADDFLEGNVVTQAVRDGSVIRNNERIRWSLNDKRGEAVVTSVRMKCGKDPEVSFYRDDKK